MATAVASPQTRSRHSLLSETNRSSYVSSNSYQTAPLGSPSQASAMSSQASLHTLAPRTPISPPLNPLHLLATTQNTGDPSTAVHILKVTDNVVQLQSGDMPDQSLVSRVGRAITGAVDTSNHIHSSDAMAHKRLPEFPTVDLTALGNGAKNNGRPSPLNTGPSLPNGFIPPPSPPSSDSPTEDEARFPDDTFDDELAIPRSDSPRGYSDVDAFVQQPPAVEPIAYAQPIHRAATSINAPRITPPEESSSTLASTSKMSIPYPRVIRDREATIHTNGLATSPISVPGSVETPAVVPDGTQQPQSYFDPRPMSMQASSSKRSTSPSGDATLLHPSSAAARPARRNTTGSAQPFVHRPSRSVNSNIGGPSLHGGLDAAGAAPLDSDILKEAEQIRKERHTKRAKAQQEAEEMMTSAHATAQAVQAEAKVLVGNLIGEDHVNYILMYNMLTGIRIGVSRFLYSILDIILITL